MKFLTFLLNAPLQSWGDSARWDHRSTASMPSKSAIIGLLGCCLGYRRGDERLPALSKSLHVAVRADCPGRLLWDFQTVQNPGGKILNAMGKPRGETIITPKQYLQDAAFQVFVYGDEAILTQCAEAMRHPRWPVCLGRRSCVPAVPVIPSIEEYDSVDEAVKKHFDHKYFDRTKKKRPEYMECQIEATEGMPDGRLITRMDEVVRADLNQYQERAVRVQMVKRSE